MGFIESMQEYGKQIKAFFLCGDVTYSDEDIISMNPHYEGSLLSSVMKCLDIELDGRAENIREGAVIQNPLLAVKAPRDTDYHYVDFGMYKVKEKKYDEEQDTTILECYDQMLDSMVPYDLALEYPKTVKDLLDAICSRLAWRMGYTTFANSDVIIEKEKFGHTYTFRDVLDQIAQVAGGMIAFSSDGLSVIYPTDSGITIDSSNLKSLKMGKVYGPVNSVVLARTPQEDNIYRLDSDSITTNGLTEIRIENNQIMDSHRDDFLDGLYGALHGLQFELYELESFGIGYLTLGDVFTIQTPDGKNHKTLMLCDDLMITQGISETCHLEAPEASETDYKAASTTDKLLNQTILKVDKQAQDITAVVSTTETIKGDIAGLDTRVTDLASLKIDSNSVDIKITRAIEGIKSITTETGYTFDHDGLHIHKTDEEMENLIDNTGMYVKRYDDNVLVANSDGVDAINLRSRQFLIVGNNSRFEDYGTNRTACFYIGGE